MTPSILAALGLWPTFARGGAVGLPASPFQPIGLPSVPTPGLASPHGLISAHRRAHFAAGGAALPPRILAALSARPHFDDGGGVDQSWSGDGGAPAPSHGAGFSPFGGPGTPDPSSGDGGQSFGGQSDQGDQGGQQAGASGPMQAPGSDWGDGGAGPSSTQPTITASLPGTALPSASRDPSGFLTNGTDPGAIARFWGASTPQGAPVTPGQPQRVAAMGAPRQTQAGDASAAAPSAPPMAAPAAPQLYNPMADPLVRSSLHLASGGRARLPDTIADALRLRPHLDNGGEAGGNSGNAGGNAGGGGGGNDGSGSDHGSNGGSSGNDGAGGSDHGSSDRGGGGSDGTGTSGAGGGVGGIGGSAGGNDGYGGGGGGGGGRSDASTGNANGSAAGIGSAAGAAEGSDRGSTTTAGGQSDASTGATNGSTAGLGSTPSSGASATSGAVGSIGGSVGAPSAGGFSSAGAPSTGGFGGFGPGPAANSNPAGLSGGTPTASSMDGRTAGQQAAAESGAGAPGEDGTTSAGAPGGLSTGQAFASFGPSATVGAFGAPPSAMQSYGAATPTGVSISGLGSVPGLSASGQQLGALGLGGEGALGAMNGVGPAGVQSGLGAYGLSGEQTPGFDNFSAAGQVQQSMLGEKGYLGNEGNDAGVGYATPGGVMDGGMLNALQGGLPGAEQPAQTNPAVAGFTPDYSGFHLGPDGTPDIAAQGAAQAASLGELGASLKGLGAFSGTTTPTGTTPGLNADGDPTAVGGVSALTVHGPMTEAAYGGYDAPGAVSPFGGITDAQAFNARQNMAAGIGTPADSAIAAGYTAQQNSQVGPTLGLSAVPSTPTADSVDPASVPAAPSSVDTTTAPTVGPLTITAATPVSPATIGEYTKRMQGFESGMDPNAVSPTGAYGLSQFTAGTWAGVAKNYPSLGLPASPRDATPEQYAAATNALTNENVSALQNAGIAPSFGAAYLAHNVGITAAVSALSKSDDTPIGAAGIPASSMAANPAVFGGVSTVGGLKSKLGSIMGVPGAPSSAPAAAPTQVATVGEALGQTQSDMLGRYAAVNPGFAIDGVSPSVPTQVNAYGSVRAHDYSQEGSAPSATFGGAASIGLNPAGMSSFGGMASSTGTTNDDGPFSTNPAGYQTITGAGYTDFNGNSLDAQGTPATTAPDTSTAQPDTSVTAHPSIPAGVTNAVAGLGLGMLGGPVGMGIAGANMVSGLVGGPTIGSMLNSALANSGGDGGAPAAPAAAGQASNGSAGTREGGYSTMPAYYGPSSGDVGTSAAPAPSSGFSPLDPHADAEAAYQAAMAGMHRAAPGSGAGSSRGDGAFSGHAHPLTVHRLNFASAIPRVPSTYDPLQDPSVRHALGL